MIDNIVAIIGIVTGLIGALRSVSETFSARVRKVPPAANSEAALLSLRTSHHVAPSDREIQIYVRTGYLVAIFGCLYVSVGGAIVSDAIDMALAPWAELIIGYLLLIEGLLFIYRASLRRQRSRLDPNTPVQEVIAVLQLDGDRGTVVRECIRAMLAIGAIRAAGCHAKIVNGTTHLQGGTGAWPIQFRGQRITLEVTGDQIQEIRILSASFWPATFQRGTNQRNVTHLIQQLVA